MAFSYNTYGPVLYSVWECISGPIFLGHLSQDQPDFFVNILKLSLALQNKDARKVLWQFYGMRHQIVGEIFLISARILGAKGKPFNTYNGKTAAIKS